MKAIFEIPVTKETVFSILERNGFDVTDAVVDDKATNWVRSDGLKARFEIDQAIVKLFA
jgi:hypothetical protein